MLTPLLLSPYHHHHLRYDCQRRQRRHLTDVCDHGSLDYKLAETSCFFRLAAIKRIRKINVISGFGTLAPVSLRSQSVLDAGVFELALVVEAAAGRAGAAVLQDLHQDKALC